MNGNDKSTQTENTGSGQTKYTTDELIEYLRAYYDEFGKRPTVQDLAKADDYPSFQAYRSRFDQWNDALQAAGFDSRPSSTEYNPDELIDQLQEFEQRLGRIPVYEDVESADDMPSVMAYRNHFGSWNEAVEAAGYSADQRTKDTSLNALLTAIIEVYEKIGSWPTIPEYNEHKPDWAITSYTFYRKSPNSVSSWTTAVDLAKQRYNDPSESSEEKLK